MLFRRKQRDAEQLELERYVPSINLSGVTSVRREIPQHMEIRPKSKMSSNHVTRRMYNSTYQAMEALRKLDEPGDGSAGVGGSSKESSKLYRIALEKKGTFGPNGVPVEYARAQVETPGKEPWNHGWTR